MPAEQRKSTKLMAMVLMPVSAVFTCWLPAAVQWYFFSAAFFGALQNIAIAQPWGRRILGLPELPKDALTPVDAAAAVAAAGASSSSPSAAAAAAAGISYQAPRSSAPMPEPEKAQNIVSELKGGFDNMLQKGRDTMDRRSRKQEVAEKLDQEEKIQEDSWEALRARMAAKEKEARSRGRRF